jgi:LysM domain
MFISSTYGTVLRGERFLDQSEETNVADASMADRGLDTRMPAAVISHGRRRSCQRWNRRNRAQPDPGARGREDVQCALAGAAIFAEGLFLANPALAQTAACADGTTVVERGDTLSRIAERCDVSERVILSAKSVQDLLDKNPDLKSRLEKVGRKVGIGEHTGAPSASVSPASDPAGSTVAVSATGLPDGSSVSTEVCSRIRSAQPACPGREPLLRRSRSVGLK